MSPAARRVYFTTLWPAACEVCDWNPRDEAQRRAVVLDCMARVRGPAVTTSDPAFGPDEVTALFTYLAHLGDPASLDKSARWATCQEDYRTFNRARQADWHEEHAYGRRPNKLARQRFAGAATAAGGPLETLDAAAVRQRHLTMANRHRRKQRAAAAGHSAGQQKANQEPASRPEPCPFCEAAQAQGITGEVPF